MLYRLDYFDSETNYNLKRTSIVFSALIFHIIKYDRQLFESLLNNFSYLDLWNTLLDHVEEEESEWSLWIIYMTVKENLLFSNLYNHTEKKHVLIDILITYIDQRSADLYSALKNPEYNLPTEYFNGEIFIKTDLITFFLNIFKCKVQSFLEHSITTEENELILLNKLSRLMLNILQLNICLFNQILKNE